LRTLYAFSILVQFNKFRIVNPKCSPSQPHTFSARLQLFDEPFAQPDVSTVVNCTVVALSVFHSTVLMRSLIFLQLWTALTYHWHWVRSPYSPVLTRCRIFSQLWTALS